LMSWADEVEGRAAGLIARSATRARRNMNHLQYQMKKKQSEAITTNFEPRCQLIHPQRPSDKRRE
jgi:hypothetical protein